MFRTRGGHGSVNQKNRNFEMDQENRTELLQVGVGKVNQKPI